MKLFVTLVILLTSLLCGDYLVKTIWNKEVKALVDVFIHGLIALIVVSPLGTPMLLFLAFTISMLIDVDHFISAKSWHLYDAVNLKNRPSTHSITFAALVGIVVWVFTKSGEIAFTIGIAITSHVLRDAPSGKTFILWPAKLQSIPYSCYIIFEIGLLVFCWLFKIWHPITTSSSLFFISPSLNNSCG